MDKVLINNNRHEVKEDQQLDDYIVILAEDPAGIVLEVLPDLLVSLDIIEAPAADQVITIKDLIICGIIKAGIIPIVLLIVVWMWS